MGLGWPEICPMLRILRRFPNRGFWLCPEAALADNERGHASIYRQLWLLEAGVGPALLRFFMRRLPGRSINRGQGTACSRRNTGE